MYQLYKQVLMCISTIMTSCCNRLTSYFFPWVTVNLDRAL